MADLEHFWRKSPLGLLGVKTITSNKSKVVSMNEAPANWQFSRTYEGSNF
jgi:hypothetical protein